MKMTPFRNSLVVINSTVRPAQDHRLEETYERIFLVHHVSIDSKTLKMFFDLTEVTRFFFGLIQPDCLFLHQEKRFPSVPWLRRLCNSIISLR